MTVTADRLLPRAASLELWLHVSVLALLLASTVRYLTAHGLGDLGAPILLTAAAFLVVWFARLPGRWTPARAILVVVLFIALALLAPSFSWLAAPVAFLVMRDLGLGWATGSLTLMVVAVSASWTRVRGDLDPTVLVGPLCLTVLTVVCYRTLAAEARARQMLLDELRDAQADLVAVERRAGALAERARLSRDLHDSVAQHLTSINLLLQAAEQDWVPRPASARAHVAQAAVSSRDSLADVRRVVSDLAPDGVEPSAHLRRLLDEVVAAQPGLGVDLAEHGTAPRAVPTEVAQALVHTVRGALANVRDHAATDRAFVTLTWDDGQVLLDVGDHGRGFDPRARPERRLVPRRGHGIHGMQERITRLGGHFTVESAPGDGTAVAVSLPLPQEIA